MATAQDVINEAKREFDGRSDEECLADLQAVHNELCWDFKLIPSEDTINLTAGTSSYSMPADCARVYELRYRTSSTRSNFTRLIATEREELDELHNHWRGTNNGKPQYYYILGGLLYLYPTPDTSTSAGYPILEIDYSAITTLASGTDLPSSLFTYRAYVEGLKSRLALREEDERYGEYMRMYTMERKRLAEQLFSRAADYRQKIYGPGTTQGFRSRA